MNLTRTEPDEWLKILHGWLPIAEFAEALERLETAQGDYLLTDPRAGFYRDAYAANEFARLMGADLVRLVAGERPDFEIDVKGAVQAYEVTEADTPGRKRGREIQDQRRRRVPGQPFVEDFPVEDWLTPEQAEIALRSAAERKLQPTYDPNCGLLILLNPVEFGAHQAAIEATMADATAAVRNRFSAVWVMWKGVAYCTWRNLVVPATPRSYASSESLKRATACEPPVKPSLAPWTFGSRALTCWPRPNSCSERDQAKLLTLRP